MIVVDGRFPGQAAGMTIGELIYLVRQLGLYSALNLDGGGSSTLWTAQEGVLNHPYDNRRFDHDVVRLTSLLPVKIVSVKCSNTNDLILCAENHLRIEIFADAPPVCEDWRFGPQDDVRLSAFTDCVHLK